jgi:hypothetical protein
MRVQLLGLACLAVSCTQDRRFGIVDTGSGQVSIEARVHPGESCALLLGKEWTAEQRIDSGRLYRGISQFDGEFQTLKMAETAPGRFCHLQAIPAAPPGTTWAAQVVVTAPGPPVHDVWISPVLTITRSADEGAGLVLSSRTRRVLGAQLGRLLAAVLCLVAAFALARFSGRWRPPRWLGAALPLALILALVGIRLRHTDPPRDVRWITADIETGIAATPLWWPLRFNDTFDRSFGMLGRDFGELFAFLGRERDQATGFQVFITHRAVIGDGWKFTLGVLLAFLFDGEVLYELREQPGPGLCLLIEAPAQENALVSNSVGQIVVLGESHTSLGTNPLEEGVK